MKKNVASQKIGAQMISATDGSNFTGEVTVYITGDAGSQGVGSVGSGICTHEGNGYHTYAPSQAETNYDLIAFTFIGTGAVSSTVQVFTTYPQTGDNFAIVNGDHGLVSIQDDLDSTKTAVDIIEDIVRNKMEITDANGNVVLRADNNSDALYSVAGGVTDNLTTTIRKRLE